MKAVNITKQPEYDYIMFGSVSVGQAFLTICDDKNLYIKTKVANFNGYDVNAVCITTGELTSFRPDANVYRVNATTQFELIERK